MKELILDVRNVENVVLMKVIQQDESTRGKGEIFKNDDINILSGEQPSVSPSWIKMNVNIRGVLKSADDLMVGFATNSTELAEGIVHNIKQAVKEYNETLKSKIKTGYERVKPNEYWYSDEFEIDEVDKTIESDDGVCSEYYNQANYYSDEKVAKNNARADTLMRQLRRFAVEENAKSGIVIDWENRGQYKYNIDYNFLDCHLMFFNDRAVKSFGQIYFTTKEIAEKAIEKFKDELTWYFTEYKDYYIEDDEEDCDTQQ